MQTERNGPSRERGSRDSATNEQRGLASGAAQEQAEKALKARDALYRNYRVQKRLHRHELYEQQPRLRAFALQLNRFHLEQAAEFLTYVQEENRGWLCTAPPEIRAEALSLINERVQRIRQGHGLVSLDDPIPDLAGRAAGAEAPEQDDNVWQLCKRELT